MAYHFYDDGMLVLDLFEFAVPSTASIPMTPTMTPIYNNSTSIKSTTGPSKRFIKPLDRPTPGDISQLIVFIFIIIFGTIGNAFVIRLFRSESRRKQAGTEFVIALAVTDLLSSILVSSSSVLQIVLLSLHPEYLTAPWPFGRFACHVLPSFNALFVSASAWLLTAISIERLRYDYFFFIVAYIKMQWSTLN